VHNLEAAAVREAKEDTGVTVAETRILSEGVHPNTGRTMVYVACRNTKGGCGIMSPQPPLLVNHVLFEIANARSLM
jgi:ADP-ribose pyrophosphatase YjhB (NUDIX family)